MGLTYSARNTYFRPMWYELDKGIPEYRYQFRQSNVYNEKRMEEKPEIRPYCIAVERGEILAGHIYYPAIFLNGLSLIIIWILGWGVKKEESA